MNHQAKIIPVSCIYMLIQSQYRPLLNVTICAKSRYARLWISIHDYKPPESDLIQRKHVSKSDRIMHSCSEWLKGMTTISASVSSCTSCFFLMYTHCTDFFNLNKFSSAHAKRQPSFLAAWVLAKGQIHVPLIQKCCLLMCHVGTTCRLAPMLHVLWCCLCV